MDGFCESNSSETGGNSKMETENSQRIELNSKMRYIFSKARLGSLTK